MTFVDTNILLRYVADDDAARSPAARRLIDDVRAGNATVWTTEVAIAEAVFVLMNPKTYGMSRQVIRALLDGLLEMPAFGCDNKPIIRQALDLFVAHPIDFPDAYHQDFDRIEGLSRLEPTVA